MDDTPRRSRHRPRDLFVAPLDQARRGQPPFQFHDIQKLYAITTIDPDRVRPFLPRGLKLADTNTGVMSINTVGGGTWGAFTVALHGVAVEGMDSPDGMPAVFWLGGAADQEGYHGYRSHYLASINQGSCRLRNEGGRIFGECVTTDGSGRIAISMTVIDPAEAGVPAEVVQDSSYHYLGDGQDGRPVIFSMFAYGKDTLLTRVDSVEISADVPPAVQAMAPVGLQWGTFFNKIDIVFNAPRAIGASRQALRGDRASGSLLSVIDRYPSPVIVVDGTNRVRFVNRRAETLPVGWVRRGRPLAEGSALGTAPLVPGLDAVRGGQMVSAPFSLQPDPAAPPLLARVLAADPRLFGPGGAVLVLNDLTGPRVGDPAGLLRLMGLTPAEARLSAALGEGLSTREASERIGVTEATARSALKSIFGKLNIGRQSELARIVARLELA